MDTALRAGPALSIGAVARIANLSIDTIRAWERRYRAIAPQRFRNGRRVFNGEDLERLMLLRGLVAGGASISSIAHHPTSELRGLVRQAIAQGESDDADVRRLIKALRAHDLWQLGEDLLATALVRGAADFGDNIVSAVLAELEHEGTESLTDELLLSSALVSISSTLFAKYRIANAPKLLSLSLPGYQSPICPLLCALVATEAGFDGIFAGTQIEPDEVEILVHELGVASVIVCAQIDPPVRLHAVLRLRGKLPDVGFILNTVTETFIPPDFIVTRSLSELPAALHYKP
ncbi:MAG TPA: MerR family transcriptional regulator [Candidatus Acidoferrum sp.]|nr:MerR family transcriptional regulator [Candidatus Acidoferrum sp.]